MSHRTGQTETEGSANPKSKFAKPSPREPSVSDSEEENNDVVDSSVENVSDPKHKHIDEDGKRSKEVKRASIAWHHAQTFIVGKGLRK